MKNAKTISDAAAGIQFEDDLFAEKGSQIGFWTAMETFLVCPNAYKSRSGFERATEASKARRWPVRLRGTGGGAVPQGPSVDNLVLAFDAPENFSFEEGYRLIVGVVRAGLGEMGGDLLSGGVAGSFCDGAWNLSVNGKKVVGTAQRWRPRRCGPPRVLVHAMILTKDDVHPGVEAVCAFHDDMDLGLINPQSHTSLESSFDLRDLPVASFNAAARAALENLHH